MATPLVAIGGGVQVLPSRFWRHVAVNASGCWLWQGMQFDNGYGRFDAGNKRLKAHRVALELTEGRPIPKGLNALHRCDTPLCVRPDHLFKGTQKANMRDAKRKFRTARGRRNGNGKLNDEQVRLIRASAPFETYTSIAKRFDISAVHVGRIVSGKRR